MKPRTCDDCGYKCHVWCEKHNRPADGPCHDFVLKKPCRVVFDVTDRPACVYVVTAYRWADKREHSYVVGCFTDQKLALAAVAAEEKYRAEKYKCEVLEVPLNNRLDEGAVECFRAVKLAFDRKGGAR